MAPSKAQGSPLPRLLAVCMPGAFVSPADAARRLEKVLTGGQRFCLASDGVRYHLSGTTLRLLFQYSVVWHAVKFHMLQCLLDAKFGNSDFNFLVPIPVWFGLDTPRLLFNKCYLPDLFTVSLIPHVILQNG